MQLVELYQQLWVYVIVAGAGLWLLWLFWWYLSKLGETK